ncbi:hypothetical protein [Avibacterium sp. 20-129]|uniref:hypothetical protein n=1 Tax=Avibacterium sp. 20-129 TaxID=2911525 RepID=UPI00224750D5|nr:hypothetical protein [Avibacterium sp. 20-129]MCW9698176.1 hypothetical protein [Avibacterium sp. 20-129]
MMTEKQKSELSSQLNQAVIQLIQAQKYLNQNEHIRSSIYIDTVQNLLPKVRQKLSIQPQ